MQYYHWLIIVSVAFIVLERWMPARPEQKLFRPGLLRDLAFFVFNGHFLGVLMALMTVPLQTALRGWLARMDVDSAIYASSASAWPVWVQFIVAFVVLDFFQWCIHNLLHRVPALWEFHKVHHSIHTMDFWGSLRFHWVEIIVYKTLQYLPFVWFGFDGGALLAVAVVATAIGHFNHANLGWDIGPMGYVLNNPRMHLWHHAHDGVNGRTVNFGISLSVWDWIFRTANVPALPPDAIGFEGDKAYPDDFFRQELWPLSRWITRRN
jgi:sterol desaturase/sphingolipid hydroxylase (fatty acid hydroxylase superfamily)